MNSGRRKMLQGTGGAAVMAVAMAAGLFKPGSAWAQWNKAAFDTKSLADAVKAMGGTTAAESKDITLTSPDIAENGAVVPFTIASKLGKTETIALLVEKNPNILAASFAIPDGTEPWVNTRVKMGQTSNVIALVKADGKFYYASKEVKVTLGGCEADMADPMKIRAAMAGDKVEVRVLMSHEMETGQRKDAKGALIPAWFIQNVTATHNGKTVLSAEWGPAVSKNPFLSFRFSGGKPGDKVIITWTDNKGDKRTDEATIA